jgi:hypothetical protein
LIRLGLSAYEYQEICAAVLALGINIAASMI